MTKYLITILVLLTESVVGQQVVKLAPMAFTAKNSFRIAEVEDLRSVKKSIGQVQKGMLNSQLPAVFESDLDVFLKKYLNAALDQSAPVPVYVQVKKFWLWEETYFAKEIGRIEAEFEVYLKREDGTKKILDERFTSESRGADVTKGHAGNVYNVLNELLTRIDASLKTALLLNAMESDTIVSADTERETEVTEWDEDRNISKLKFEDASEYGSKVSLGIALGGGGIIGIPLRFYPAPKIALEAGGYFRPFFESQNEQLIIHPGIMLAGGMVIYAKKNLHKGANAKLQGLCLKGGHSFGNYPESFGAIGWAMEKIKWADNSFSAEIGAGVLTLHSNDATLNYGLTGSKIQPLLYWKLHWSWYLEKKKKQK